jgi:hypothetical protein
MSRTDKGSAAARTGWSLSRAFNTATGRAKPKHLEHDPRASLLVVDPNDD